MGSIKTKFEIGDLIRYKYQSDPKDRMVAMEVIEITSVTCIAGTQVFYKVRELGAEKEFEGFGSDRKHIGWSAGTMKTSAGTVDYRSFREDELVVLAKDKQKIFKSFI